MAWVREFRVRELLRLQRHALAFESAEQVQRDELVQGLVRILGAEIGLFVEDPNFVHGGAGALRALSGHNIEPARRALEMVLEDRAQSPILAKLLDAGSSGLVVVRGKDAIPRRDWYRSLYFQEGIRPSHCDEVLGAAMRLEGNAVLGINVLRAKGTRAFSAEDAAVVGLFMESCGPVLRRRLTWAERLRLTPRQTQVFDCLMAGASNKEIADLLECSPRTAEVHVANVLRKCGASTRAQLPARVRALQQP